MAGDSAGAQITSQVVALITNPAYTAELGLTPSLKPAQLRAVVLHCGIYDLVTFMERANLTGGDFGSKVLRLGNRTVIWAYTGSRDRDSIALQQISSINHRTPDFPPTFISGGNGDPLTDHHSRPLAAKLEGLGVDVWTLFCPPDHESAMGDEYQFNFDNADGQNALTQTLEFLNQHTGS